MLSGYEKTITKNVKIIFVNDNKVLVSIYDKCYRFNTDDFYKSLNEVSKESGEDMHTLYGDIIKEFNNAIKIKEILSETRGIMQAY